MSGSRAHQGYVCASETNFFTDISRTNDAHKEMGKYSATMTTSYTLYVRGSGE